jgi:hypothetical protein
VQDPSQAKPTEMLFREVLAEHGLTLSEDRLAAALIGHRGAHSQLERLREFPLSFLEPVVEPASAMRWIEAGGVSQ